MPRILGEDDAGRWRLRWSGWIRIDIRYGRSQLRDGVVDVHTARAVAARFSGRMHRATAGDSSDRWHELCDDDAAFYAIRLEPYLEASARAHPDHAPALRQLIAVTTAATKHALVHGDVSPKNILVGPKGPVLLDAECAWYGDPAFDLAFCLNHLLLKCRWRPASTDALLTLLRRAGAILLEPCRLGAERGRRAHGRRICSPV